MSSTAKSIDLSLLPASNHRQNQWEILDLTFPFLEGLTLPTWLLPSTGLWCKILTLQGLLELPLARDSNLESLEHLKWEFGTCLVEKRRWWMEWWRRDSFLALEHKSHMQWRGQMMHKTQRITLSNLHLPLHERKEALYRQTKGVVTKCNHNSSFGVV